MNRLLDDSSKGQQRRVVVGSLVLGAAVGAATLDHRAVLAVVAVLLAGLTIELFRGRSVVGLLVISSFVTLVRLDVGGAHLRVEHFVVVACLATLVAQGRVAKLVAVACDRTLLLFGSFVAWSAAVAVFQARLPGESLMTVAWLALDWVLLVILVTESSDAREVARTGVIGGTVAGAIGIGCWITAHSIGTSFGVSQAARELSGARSASGLSFEPNLLGATLALWAFVALSRSARLSSRTRVVMVVIAVAGILVSFTRAAGVGLLAGLAVWAVRGSRAVRTTLSLVVTTTVVVLALATFAPRLAKPVATRASQALDFSSGTGQSRVQSWELALHDLRGPNLVFGLGTASFGQRHLEPTLPGTPTPATLGNFPLQVLYETGIVGCLLLGATLASLLTTRRLRDGRALGLLAVYLGCATATSLFAYATTWVFVAIALIDRRRIVSEEPANRLGPPVRALHAAVG